MISYDNMTTKVNCRPFDFSFLLTLSMIIFCSIQQQGFISTSPSLINNMNLPLLVTVPYFTGPGYHRESLQVLQELHYQAR